MTTETKTCQNCKGEFVIDEQDQAFYKKLEVPLPTFCWLCRAQRRMAFRNERSIFRRKSDSSGNDIFSAFAPDAPVKVYEKDVWLSDDWDPMQYGRDYDFSRPFFEQFKELLHEVPLKNLNLVNSVNSDFCNNFTDPKDSYLVFNGKGAENCMYGNGFSFSKDCMDTSHIARSEWCYEGFWLTSCSNTLYSSQCENSFNLMFCKNCIGCNDCFGSVNLRNKSYYIFNKPYPKEEYERIVSSFALDSYANRESMKKRAYEHWRKFPTKFIEGTHNNDVSGEYISHSKNVKNSFLVREGENLRYCQYVQELPPSRDCYDYTAWGDGNELIYECCACGIGTNKIKFCYNVQENVHDIEYSYMCMSASYLFGCIGVRKRQYCILNKHYAKGEYEELRNRILQQMEEMPYHDAKGRIYRYGEFFPVEISPFAYNETLAHEYFPISKDNVVKEGYAWRDRTEKNYTPTMQAKDLPDRIQDVPETITGELIGCSAWDENPALALEHNCTKVFRILPNELAFYRSLALPLPRKCPNSRHHERINQRNTLQLWSRQCQCAGKGSDNGLYSNDSEHTHKREHCPNTFETCYSPSNAQIIYCEACYLAEVM